MMKNLNLFFENQNQFDYADINVSCTSSKGVRVYEVFNNSISGADINAIVLDIMSMPHDSYIFKFKNIRFQDGLVSLFLDVIIYYLKSNNLPVSFSISFDPLIKSQGIAGIDSYMISCINLYQNQFEKTPFPKMKVREKKVKLKIEEDFLKFFLEKSLGSKYHKRLFIRNEELMDFEDFVFEELDPVFKFHKIEDDVTDSVVESIYELIENISEKTDGDFLLQIFISDILVAGIETKMLEVNVLSFQTSTIIKDVMKFYNKLSSEEIDNIYLSNEYKKLKKYYNIHKKLFNENYTNEHFYLLSAFHSRVSSRLDKFGKGGGTGLPELINRINTNVYDEGYSYVYSGNQVIRFRKGTLIHEEGIVSFNTQADINKPPNDEVIGNAMYMPGVAYNLVFPL